MPLRFLALVALFSSPLLACSSTSTSADAGSADGAPTPTDASLPVDGSPPPDAAGGCNALVNGGTVISKTTHPEPTPTMTGGPLVDGTYFLTAMDKYNGKVGSNTHKETLVFSGGRVESVNLQSDKPGEQRASGTYSTSGTTLTLNITCPVTATLNSPYTATPTQITFVNANDPNEAHTYTKR